MSGDSIEVQVQVATNDNEWIYHDFGTFVVSVHSNKLWLEVELRGVPSGMFIFGRLAHDFWMLSIKHVRCGPFSPREARRDFQRRPLRAVSFTDAILGATQQPVKIAA